MKIVVQRSKKEKKTCMDKDKTYNTRAARLWKLFLSTLYISSFTFGGGFVIVTFMKKKFVESCIGSMSRKCWT